MLLLDFASLLCGVCSHGNGVLCADDWLDGHGGDAQRGRWCLMCIYPEVAEARGCKAHGGVIWE